ncbi:LIM-domain binding protein-domain-containing protein [Rhodocollybia butyracea]|uniref:LIM-domain binding protein-domain-containing protein n=1 Tax=Rhodocollybia butyracea TaxID=206335 RepID=A0A9P5UEX2_9AGAR|nr:LIM-domain binding protein-domain-containing protein [Rhodocollybia butyracea]
MMRPPGQPMPGSAPGPASDPRQRTMPGNPVMNSLSQPPSVPRFPIPEQQHRYTPPGPQSHPFTFTPAQQLQHMQDGPDYHFQIQPAPPRPPSQNHFPPTPNDFITYPSSSPHSRSTSTGPPGTTAPQRPQPPPAPQPPTGLPNIAPRPPSSPTSSVTPPGPTAAAAAAAPPPLIPRQTASALGHGQGLIRLLQFSGNLASESKQKHQLSWWTELIREYFTPKAVMRFTLWRDNQRNEAKPFEITVPILPRFLLVTTQSGVKSMTLTLDGARERLHGNGHAIVECVAAVWTYKYNNGYTVALRGPLTVHVWAVGSQPAAPNPTPNQPPVAPNQNYVLKFDEFQFDASYHDKYIALESIMGPRSIESPMGMPGMVARQGSGSQTGTPRVRNAPPPGAPAAAVGAIAGVGSSSGSGAGSGLSNGSGMGNGMGIGGMGMPMGMSMGMSMDEGDPDEQKFDPTMNSSPSSHPLSRDVSRDKWEEPRVLIERGFIPGEPVNAFGIPQATMRCLELAESVAQMTELISFSREMKLGPIEALSKMAGKIRESMPLGQQPLINGVPGSGSAPGFTHSASMPNSPSSALPPYGGGSFMPGSNFPGPGGMQPMATLYSSAPPSVTNPSSQPNLSSANTPHTPHTPAGSSPQNIQNGPASAHNSPRKVHKNIPQANPPGTGGTPGSSTTASGSSGSTTVTSGGSTTATSGTGSGSSNPSSTHTTPAMAPASLKRKQAAVERDNNNSRDGAGSIGGRGGDRAGVGPGIGDAGGSSASGTGATSPQPPPAKRNTRKRGRTTGG